MEVDSVCCASPNRSEIPSGSEQRMKASCLTFYKINVAPLGRLTLSRTSYMTFHKKRFKNLWDERLGENGSRFLWYASCYLILYFLIFCVENKCSVCYPQYLVWRLSASKRLYNYVLSGCIERIFYVQVLDR